MKRTLLATTIVFVAACATPEDTIQGKPPKDEAADGLAERRIQTEKPEAEKRPQYPPPGLSLASWPFEERHTTFTLTWEGGNRAAKLHEAPDPNSPLIGEVSWDNGERILWQATVLSVYQPRIARAKGEWFAEGPVHSEGYATSQDFVTLELRKGQQLQIWAYAGDGICYMAKKKDIFSGPCPPRDLFRGLGAGKVRAEWYSPQQRLWWVQISGGGGVSGWFVVDDRVAVDIIDQ